MNKNSFNRQKSIKKTLIGKMLKRIDWLPRASRGSARIRMQLKAERMSGYEQV